MQRSEIGMVSREDAKGAKEEIGIVSRGSAEHAEKRERAGEGDREGDGSMRIGTGGVG